MRLSEQYIILTMRFTVKRKSPCIQTVHQTHLWGVKYSGNGNAALALFRAHSETSPGEQGGHLSLDLQAHFRGRSLEVPGDPYVKLASRHNPNS